MFAVFASPMRNCEHSIDFPAISADECNGFTIELNKPDIVVFPQNTA